jgi:hypothetical protein
MFWTWVFFALFWGALAGWIASARCGAPFGAYFVYGLILGPFGLIPALFAGAKCPHCQSKVHYQATACPKCTRSFVAAAAASVGSSATTSSLPRAEATEGITIYKGTSASRILIIVAAMIGGFIALMAIAGVIISVAVR